MRKGQEKNLSKYIECQLQLDKIQKEIAFNLMYLDLTVCIIHTCPSCVTLPAPSRSPVYLNILTSKISLKGIEKSFSFLNVIQSYCFRS